MNFFFLPQDCQASLMTAFTQGQHGIQLPCSPVNIFLSSKLLAALLHNASLLPSAKRQKISDAVMKKRSMSRKLTVLPERPWNSMKEWPITMQQDVPFPANAASPGHKNEVLHKSTLTGMPVCFLQKRKVQASTIIMKEVR